MAIQINRTITVNVALNALECPACGVVFAITGEYDRERRADGLAFWCPNGHDMSYSETEADRLRKQLAHAKLAASSS